MKTQNHPVLAGHLTLVTVVTNYVADKVVYMVLNNRAIFGQYYNLSQSDLVFALSPVLFANGSEIYPTPAEFRTLYRYKVGTIS